MSSSWCRTGNADDADADVVVGADGNADIFPDDRTDVVVVDVDDDVVCLRCHRRDSDVVAGCSAGCRAEGGHDGEGTWDDDNDVVVDADDDRKKTFPAVDDDDVLCPHDAGNDAVVT